MSSEKFGENNSTPECLILSKSKENRFDVRLVKIPVVLN
jgi:hypothetical protein